MPTRVLLPKFGQTVETSEIVGWMKKEGDAVRKGEILCEIATDKSSLEVESQHEGTLLRILLAPGKTAPVGCVMALIGDAGEKLDDALIAECLATQTVLAAAPASPAAAAPAPVAAKPPPAPSAPAPAAPKPAPPRAAPTTPADGRRFVSPRARKFAAAAEVPVAVLSGSGENGRIVEADVHAYVEAIGTVSPAARTQAFQRGLDLRGLVGSGPGGQITVADLATRAPAAKNGAAHERAFTIGELPALVAKLEKPNPMRRAIAQNMALSASTIPAFQLEVTVDAARLIARREAAKAAGEKVSFGDIIARAVAVTIRRHAAFAATWTDQGVQYRDRVHIGFAVALPGALVVPVVGDCDLRSVGEIARESAALVEKARAGRLAPDDYTGAVFTLSNLGAFPVDRFVAIVPPGQSGIIAIGRIRDELVARGGGFFPAKLLSLTLSADHRYIDGADGAAFMRDLKELLEHADAL